MEGFRCETSRRERERERERAQSETESERRKRVCKKCVGGRDEREKRKGGRERDKDAYKGAAAI